MSYSLGPFYRAFIFGVSGFFVLGIILAAVHLVTSNEVLGVRAFLIVWMIVAGFIVYRYLFTIAYDLRQEIDQLAWKAPLRSGIVPLRNIQRIRCRWGDGVIYVSSRGCIHVLAQKGFVRFASTVGQLCPWVEVRVGWSARFMEWLPASTAFHG